MSMDGYFEIAKVVYSRLSPDQTNSNTTNSVNMQNIPFKKESM